MKSNNALKRLILRQIHYKKPEEGLKQYPPDEALTQMRFLGEKGFISGQIIRDGSGQCATVVGVDLTPEGSAFLQELEQEWQNEQLHQHGSAPDMQAQSLAIFVSHSSKDEPIAHALVDLYRAALNLSHKQIRCTSVNGYRLEGGASAEQELRVEVNSARVLVGLVTPSSMESAYVFFELGARWGQNLSIIPLLAAGADSKLLRGPLSNLNALRCDDPAQVHQMIENLAKKLGATELSSPAAYQSHIEKLIEISKRGSASTETPKVVPRDRSGDLDPYELKIMTMFLRDDKRQLLVTAVAKELKIHQLRAEDLLKRLVKRKLLFRTSIMAFFLTSELTYGLTLTGRKFLLEKGLI